MSFSPQVLLSRAARERCMANIKNLPVFVNSDVDSNSKVHASVLVPLCVVEGEVCILYTLRSSNLNSHSGQVSFPGGKIDEGETEINAVLRETKEEIGFNPEDIEIWGEMPLVQGRNKAALVIRPVVGVLKNLDLEKLEPNPYEVEEIFTVTIKELCNVEKHGNLYFDEVIAPVYMYEKHKIWGITGVITHMFLHCFLPDNLYTNDFMRKSYSFDELMPAKL